MKFNGPLLLIYLLAGLLTTCHKFPNPDIHGTIKWTVNNEAFEAKTLAVAYSSNSDSIMHISGFLEDDNNMELTLQMVKTPGVYMAGENYWPPHQVHLRYAGKSYQAFVFETGSKVTISITSFTRDHISGTLEGKAVSGDRQTARLQASFDLSITR